MKDVQSASRLQTHVFANEQTEQIKYQDEVECYLLCNQRQRISGLGALSICGIVSAVHD